MTSVTSSSKHFRSKVIGKSSLKAQCIELQLRAPAFMRWCLSTTLTALQRCQWRVSIGDEQEWISRAALCSLHCGLLAGHFVHYVVEMRVDIYDKYTLLDSYRCGDITGEVT